MKEISGIEKRVIAISLDDNNSIDIFCTPVIPTDSKSINKFKCVRPTNLITSRFERREGWQRIICRDVITTT